MFAKLLKPGDGRSGRWRNARDEPVTGSRVLRNFPRAVGTFLLSRGLGYRPTQPWIGYDAIARLNELLRPDMRALEYGSGMSTMWFARRVKDITAVEDSAEWAGFQRKQLARKNYHNVEIIDASTKDAYVRPPAAGLAPAAFDFIMIDGRWRDACAEAAIEVVKPGGLVYLDNSDVTQFNSLDGNVQRARDLLEAAALGRGGKVEHFLDFAPGLLFATSGHLYHF